MTATHPFGANGHTQELIYRPTPHGGHTAPPPAR